MYKNRLNITNYKLSHKNNQNYWMGKLFKKFVLKTW